MTDSEQVGAAASGNPRAPSSDPSNIEARLPRRHLWYRLIGLIVPALVLLPRLGAGGFWDPYELDTADLARRIAIHVWGAKSLALAGGDNSLPSLETLGRGELPFSSIGLGFSLFGLHEWAGRLPLVLWALAGVWAAFWMVQRLIDDRAAMYTAVILSTMPLYFVQARTMLGDIVTMASISMAVAGMAVLLFDERASLRIQAAAALVGVVGLVDGFLSRGLIVGVAFPALTVGLAWVALRLSGPAERGSEDDNRAVSRTSVVAASVVLLVGVVAASYGGYLLATKQGHQAVRLLGTTLATQTKSIPFDNTFMYLGFALFPWSAFLPLAVGRLFRPGTLLQHEQGRRELALRAVMLVGAGLGFGAFDLMTETAGHMPFAGVIFFAGIGAIVLRDLDRGAPPSRTLALVVVTFLALFARDFSLWPKKAFSPFGVDGVSFPESFKHTGFHWIVASLAIFGLVFFASWMERTDPEHRGFAWKDYVKAAKEIWGAGEGKVAVFALVVEVFLIGLAATFLGGRLARWPSIVKSNAYVQLAGLNAWWAVPLMVAGAILAGFLLRDATRAFFARLSLPRGGTAVFGGVVAGAVLSLAYYPALASQLSPKEVFETYATQHQSGEPLGLIGINGRAAGYYAGGHAKALSTPGKAISWLLSGPSRRWLVLRHHDLARLNAAYRTRRPGHGNLPVVDARSSQILLAVSQLDAGRKNHNPLDHIVLSTRPKPAHPLDVDLEGKLLAIGWEVVTDDGKPVRTVLAGKQYHMHLYYKVTGRISRQWKTFIHIDGHGRRFNGDHDTTAKKYPMTSWRAGDYVLDDYPFRLEPNFTPGRYTLYYGLFIGNSRLKVTRGKNDGNRIIGGTVDVR